MTQTKLLVTCWLVALINGLDCGTHLLEMRLTAGLGKLTVSIAGSYFSRLRRMVDGQHHGVSPQFLYQYANHAAWLEDNRRTDNGTLAKIVVSNSMAAPVSRQWQDYWQRAA